MRTEIVSRVFLRRVMIAIFPVPEPKTVSNVTHVESTPSPLPLSVRNQTLLYKCSISVNVQFFVGRKSTLWPPEVDQIPLPSAFIGVIIGK